MRIQFKYVQIAPGARDLPDPLTMYDQTVSRSLSLLVFPQIGNVFLLLGIRNGCDTRLPATPAPLHPIPPPPLRLFAHCWSCNPARLYHLQT